MITLQDIKSVYPCWTEEKLTAKWAGRKSTTYTEIANDQTVSVNDRRWLMTQLAARTRAGRTALVLWAASCAQDVRHLVRGEDRDTTDAAIAAAVAYVENPSEETAEAAAWAAWAARAAEAAAWAAWAAAGAEPKQLNNLASALEAL